jgi:DNA-binding CsgD family transcriptional regulator
MRRNKRSTRPATAFERYSATTNAQSLLDAVVREFSVKNRLSPREETVVRAAADGRDRKSSAALLGCSAGTVDTYWGRIFKKTGCRSQTEVFAKVVQFGITLRAPADSGSS